MEENNIALSSKKHRKTFAETRFGLFLLNRKNLWIKLFVPFIITYFLLVSLPYFAYNVPVIGPFVSSGNTKLLFRGLVIALFIVYALLINFVLSLKVHWRWIFLFSIIAVTSLFIPIFSPTFLVSSYQDPQYLYWTISSVSVGYYDIVSSFISLCFDLIFAYCFMFILPYCLRKRSQIIWCALPLIILMVVECAYSLYAERDIYKEILSGHYSDYGGYDLVIKATFGSKNDFGDFLLQAFLSCVLCFMFMFKRKRKWFFLIPGVLFTVMSLLSLCKTAILGILFFALVAFIMWIVYTFKKKVVRNTIICSIIAFLFIAFIVFMAFPQIHDANSLFQKVYSFFNTLIFDSAKKTIDERAELWSLSFNMMRGPSIFFGYGKTISNYNLYALSGETNRWFHNGFIMIYCSYGIIGLTIYLLGICYVFLRILNTIKFNKTLGISFLAIFLSFFVLTMSEQVIMLISGSANVFAYNFILVLVPFAYLISAKQKGEFYESCI
jgi:O-antigen ligase